MPAPSRYHRGYLVSARFALGSILLCAARVWAADARCPASFAKASGACDERVTPASHICAYPEGKCACVRSTPCSGVPQPPGEPRWRCQAARTDGCPNDAPAQGATCASAGKTCSYGDCGSLAYTCDAQKRTWFISGRVGPPPSMPESGAVTPTAPPSPPAWKVCPGGKTFRCTARSQGAAPAPGETVPQVCGCIPRCPSSRRVLVAFEADGRWPDGSRKGRFVCATAGLPRAAPPSGM